MKKKLLAILTTFISGSSLIQAQCISPTAYGTININGCVSTSVTITTNIYKGEYNTLYVNNAGIYTFNATGGTLTNYLTLTDNFNNPISSGVAPIQATIAATGVYRLHLSSPTCASESVAHTTSFNCTIPSCNGAPSPGIISSTLVSVCPNSPAILNVTSPEFASGATFQWQQSTSPTGPFTDVTSGSGGTTVSYTTAPITTAMYYQMVTTCTTSSLSSTTSVVSVVPEMSSACYCTTNLGGGGCSTGYITNVSILSTSFNNTSTCNTVSGSTYSQFNPGPTTTAILPAGSTYSISVTTNGSSIESFWIDYNQNNIYDASEYYLITSSSVSNTASVYSFSVPLSALTGPTGMRIRSRGVGNPNGPADACTSFGSGETEDYIVYIASPVACSGVPGVGILNTTSLTICPNESGAISVSGSPTGFDITYQWQESSSPTGPFTNVAGGVGATTTSYSTPGLQATMYYQMVTTCTTSAMSSTTGIVSVYRAITPTCYCNTNLGGSSCSVDYITNVSIASTPLNNTSSCGMYNAGSTYTYYIPGPTTTATLAIGSTYSVSINSTANSVESLWIDYNQNGFFESNEHSQICMTSTPGTATVYNLTIPVSALTGYTGMRIRSRASGNPNGATDACSTFGSGEAEDYIVYIDAPLSTGIRSSGLIANALIIYPNPASESITISTGAFLPKSRIIIYNSIGAIVNETELTESSVNIRTDHLANGVYTVKLISEDGTASQKLIISK